VLAKKTENDLEHFASHYYNQMIATQSPDATEKELDAYLVLLKDNVGHTHLPWVRDDSRHEDGKAQMRKGMTFYLGSHTEFNAKLLDVFIFNTSAIAIRYEKHAKGIHPQSKQPIMYTQTIMEVLELEDGLVGVIRKYHE
jgi:hypothetical protein